MANGGSRWWTAILQGMGVALGLGVLSAVLAATIHVARDDIHETITDKTIRTQIEISNQIKPLKDDIADIKRTLDRIEDRMWDNKSPNQMRTRP